jgi:flagellar biosynthesis/type III secretory pathway M-ring protein FliF/YscJ
MNRNDAEFNQRSAEYQNMGMQSQLKDAQANKTISIVTMTFLPATAVAAICSMNVFDWQRPDKVYVSPHFWVFWVASIILTALVIGVFLIWKRRLHAKARQREREEEEEKGSKDEDSDEDSAIPKVPQFRASERQQERKVHQRHVQPDNEEKEPQNHQQEERDELVRATRRKSRHRSHSRRSHTTSRERRNGPEFIRTASGLSFRGESTIV